MAQQTGSISFEATNAFSSYASGEYATKETATALQTAIEQNAEAIELRATKTEAQQMAQPNLSPFYSYTFYDATYWWSSSYPFSSELGKCLTQLEDGWAHIDFDNSARTARAYHNVYVRKPIDHIKPSTKYTFVYEVRNFSKVGDGAVVVYLQGVQASDQMGTMSGSAAITGDGTYRLYATSRAEFTEDMVRPVRACVYIDGSTNAQFDVRASMYEGEYEGPYKPYIGTQLYASQAELKVANDAISLKVSKNDVINQINVSTEGATIAANRVNVEGATIFTSGRLSQSSLNAAYDAKGAAATVQGNLDNLAIGGTNLLGATANPSSKQIVLNSAGASTFGDITNYNDAISLYSFEDFDGHSNSVKWTTSSTGNRGVGWYTKVGAIKAGETYTFSCKVMSSVATSVHTHTAWRNGSATANYTGWTAAGSVAIAADEWTDYSYSFVPHSGAKLDWEFYVALCFSGSSGGATFRIAHAKLEHGNRATDWNPAPEDHTAYVDEIQIGGRNLLRDTTFTTALGTYWINNGLTASISDSSLVIDGSTASGNKRIYHGTDYFKHSTLTPYTFSCDAVATATCQISFGRRYSDVDEGGTTFTVTTTKQRISGTYNATYWGAFCISQPTNDATVTLSNLKLEVGNKATDWTPAPEDIEANAVKRTQRIYYRSDSATKPATPSAWVTKEDDGTGAWTKMHVAITSTHKYIYTCEQSEKADGTLGCTTVLRDNTITVIDGGNIITNSIDANRLTVYDANIGKIKADAIDVSSIAIGDLNGASTVVNNAANGKSAYDRHTAYRGTCSTAAGTAAKVVTCTGFALATGATVEVYCSTANTANVPTLNVNSTGAKAVWINGAVASASNPCKWLACDTVTFTYDGTRFRASLPVEGYVTEGTGGGLMVHRKSDATTGVQITDDVDIMRNNVVVNRVSSDGMTLYDGEVTDGQGQAIIARFTGDEVQLGASSSNAIIYLCRNTGIMKAKNGAFIITGESVSTQSLHDKGSVVVGESASINDGVTTYSGLTQIIARNDYGDEAHLNVDSYLSAGSWSGSGISLDAERVYLNADTLVDGSLTLSTPLADTYIDSVSASKLTGTIADSNLPTKGSAGTAGTSSATSGATLAVPYVTTDAYGRVTAKGTHTHTIGSLAASAVSSGTFDEDRIPSLNASKINAGTLASARLPTVPIGHGGTGQTGYSTVTSAASVISAASGVTITNIALIKWGYLCQLTLTVSPSAAKTSAWTAGTVVQAYRPAARVTGRPYHTTVEAAQIATNGTLSVTACGANASIPVSFTYMLASS